MKIRHLILFGVLVLGNWQVSWAMARRPEAGRPASAVQELRPLTLWEAFELALSRSEKVAIQKEEIAKTHADWFKAMSEGLGDVDFISTDNLQDRSNSGSGSSGSSVGSTFSAQERRERSLEINQPLFQGFRATAAVLAAGSLTEQRRQEYFHAQENLFIEVVAAFNNLLEQQKDVETIQGIHDLLEERIKDLKKREEIGRSRTSEVSTAVSKMRSLEAQLAQAEGELAVAGHILEFYTGLPANTVKASEEPLPKDLDEALDLDAAVSNRSDVEAAREAMRVARQAIVVAQSGLWPRIDLKAHNYEKREGFQSDIDWDVLFKIDIPLFRGGENVGKIKEAWSNYKQAKLQYSLTRRQAELEIKNTYERWQASYQASKAYELAVKASQENYRQQKEDYDRSLVNNLDVLDALESLFNTSRNATSSHYQMKLNYWRYKTALGNDWSPAVTGTLEPEGEMQT